MLYVICFAVQGGLFVAAALPPCLAIAAAVRATARILRTALVIGALLALAGCGHSSSLPVPPTPPGAAIDVVQYMYGVGTFQICSDGKLVGTIQDSILPDGTRSQDNWAPGGAHARDEYTVKVDGLYWRGSFVAEPDGSTAIGGQTANAVNKTAPLTMSLADMPADGSGLPFVDAGTYTWCDATGVNCSGGTYTDTNTYWLAYVGGGLVLTRVEPLRGPDASGLRSYLHL